MPKKLLIVDDEPAITKIIGKIASSADYEIKSVNDATQAMAVFRSFRPDVLMIDMIMPDVDGVDILRDVMAISRDVKVIIMTGFGPGYLRLAKAVALFDEKPDITELEKPFRRTDVLFALGEAERGTVSTGEVPRMPALA
jgi:two-component system, OmpR family, response regulator